MSLPALASKNNGSQLLSQVGHADFLDVLYCLGESNVTYY